MRWNQPAAWLWSTERTHEPLVTPEDFAAVQQIMDRGQGERTEAKQRTATRRYSLSGLVTCALCGRRMQGTWNHSSPHYRCTYASEYAKAKGLTHPKAVYLREDRVVPKLDEWIGQLFDPDHIDETCEALAVASMDGDAAAAKEKKAREQIADCDSRLVVHRVNDSDVIY